MNVQPWLQHGGLPGVQSIVASREVDVLQAEEEGRLLCQPPPEYQRLPSESLDHPNSIYWATEQVFLPVNILRICFAQFHLLLLLHHRVRLEFLR